MKILQTRLGVLAVGVLYLTFFGLVGYAVGGTGHSAMGGIFASVVIPAIGTALWLITGEIAEHFRDRT